MDIEKEVALMRRKTVNELRVQYGEVFGEATNNRNKIWLIKRIAWRMQANIEGDLSERARKRAMEIANDADIRMSAPRTPKLQPNAAQRTETFATGIQPSRNLLPGTMLQRVYKGQNVFVTVLENGFSYQGKSYKSLTAAVKAITGKHWNGFGFFGLTDAPTPKQKQVRL